MKSKTKKLTVVLMMLMVIFCAIPIHAEEGNDYDEDYYDPEYYDILSESEESSQGWTFKTIEDYDIDELEDFEKELFDLFNEYRVANNKNPLEWSDTEYQRSKEQSDINVIQGNPGQGINQLALRKENVTPQDCLDSATFMNLNDAIMLSDDFNIMGVYACTFDKYTTLDYYSVVVSYGFTDTTSSFTKPHRITLIIAVCAMVLVVVAIALGIIIKKRKSS